MSKRALVCMIVAVLGFMGGYLLGVFRWAGNFGIAAGEFLGASYSGAALAALVCAGLAYAWTPAKKSGEESYGPALPAAFLVPFTVSALGLRAALWCFA